MFLRNFIIILVIGVGAMGAVYVLSTSKKEPIDPLTQTPPGVSRFQTGTSSVPVLLGKQKEQTRSLRAAGPIDAILDSPQQGVVINPSGKEKRKPIISPEDYLFLEPEKPSPPRYVSLILGEKTFRVEHAYDLRKQIKGLSGRNALDSQSGLFYAFADSGTYHFWMRGMLFPIDIIWIGSDRRVVDIRENISPDTFPQKFTSREPAQYVLEVNAGFSKRNGITAGTSVDLSQFLKTQ